MKNTLNNPSKWIIDMVHHNPGEAPFDTRFTDPLALKSRGYNAQCFKHINTVLRLEASESKVLSDAENVWLEKFTAERVSEIKAAKEAGLAVFYHVDLFVLPKRIVEARKDELCDENGKISIHKPATLELHRQLFAELFERFPDIDGLIPRVGETYLYDTPFHTGNGAVKYQGEEHSPAKPEEIDDFVTLLNFLREEVCEKHGRWLIHRTWDTRPDRFHANQDFYLKVTNQVPPHQKLLFSIKHTQIDFQRYTAWNPCLGHGQHKQILEVQCQREYEGKGAYPNYSTLGVIEGFTESNPGSGLNSFINDPLFSGVYTWTRGGGWYGPSITKTNEFWCDLNASVLTNFVNDPHAGELAHFEEFCHKNGIVGHDVERVRVIATQSLEALLKGKCCKIWDTRPGSEKDNFPTNMWMRDDVLAGWEHLEAIFKVICASETPEAALIEKTESVELWSNIVSISETLEMHDAPELKSVIQASCVYGYRLFDFIAKAWTALYHGYCRENDIHHIEASEIQHTLAKADAAWESYQALPKEYPQAATLYRGHAWHWPQQPAPDGIQAALNSLRAS